MPIVSGGEWWNQNSRPMLKARAGAVTADVEQGDVNSCAVTSGALAASSVTCTALADAHVTSGKLAAGSVTCTALAAEHVTAEKASTNLASRTYLVILEPPEPSGLISGGSSIGGWSTTYAVWRPLTPIVIQRVQAFVQRAYEHACNDSITLYGNSGTCIGDVYFCGQSTAIAGGTRIAGGNLNLVNLPACTNVLARWAVSTCSVASPVALQFDVLASG